MVADQIAGEAAKWLLSAAGGGSLLGGGYATYVWTWSTDTSTCGLTPGCTKEVELWGGLVTASSAADVGAWGVLPVMVAARLVAGGWVLHENGNLWN